jgi:HlyD family secretion protein
MINNKWAMLLILGVGLYFSASFFSGDEKDQAPVFQTITLDRGVVIETVSATGTVKPITLVEVGSQVSGRIEKIHVDFNSRVKANQIICELDQVPLKARTFQDEANLAKARARLKQSQANLNLAKVELKRSIELDKEELISKSELDKEKANVEALSAQLELSQAEVDQAKASLQVSQANLEYATIRSPVDGIVILRNVDVGQTVAASFQAPVLFKIAQNLKELHILAAVSEADIGQIEAGQQVNFKVAAHPYDDFTGQVIQVRLAAKEESNVITYTVVVAAKNPENKLYPGMTAEMLFEIGRSAENDLRVPNAAIRFEPSPEWVAPSDEDPAFEGQGKRSGPPLKTVWVKDGPFLKVIKFKGGFADRIFTEIRKGALSEKTEVVIGIHVEGFEDEGTTNPFIRSRNSSGKKKKKK